MAEPSPTPPRRMSAGLRVVFFLSLALNLLIAGLALGFVLRGGPDAPPPRDTRTAVAPYTDSLSREDRREIGRRLFRDMRADGAHRDMRDRARAEYLEALTLLRAEPFDEVAFDDLLSRQNARAADWQMRGQSLLVAHIAQMSAEERAAFADRVAENLERRRKRRKP